MNLGLIPERGKFCKNLKVMYKTSQGQSLQILTIINPQHFPQFYVQNFAEASPANTPPHSSPTFSTILKRCDST